MVCGDSGGVVMRDSAAGAGWSGVVGGVRDVPDVVTSVKRSDSGEKCERWRWAALRGGIGTWVVGRKDLSGQR